MIAAEASMEEASNLHPTTSFSPRFTNENANSQLLSRPSFDGSPELTYALVIQKELTINDCSFVLVLEEERKVEEEVYGKKIDK